MEKERKKINKQIIRRTVKEVLIYLWIILACLLVLKILEGLISFTLSLWEVNFKLYNENFWSWLSICMFIFGWPFYRKKREQIKALLTKFSLWIKSLNWNKEDYKKIIIAILIIIFASIFIMRPLIRSINGIDV